MNENNTNNNENLKQYELNNLYIGNNIFLDILLKPCSKSKIINPLNGEYLDTTDNPIDIDGYLNYSISISGNNGNSFGQMIHLLPSKYENFKNLHKLYHLNDLTAGTKKQYDCLVENGLLEGKLSSYDDRTRILKDNNLLFDNGYKYGSSWLLRLLPTSVHDYIVNIYNVNELYNQKLLEEVKFSKDVHYLSKKIKNGDFYVHKDILYHSIKLKPFIYNKNDKMYQNMIDILKDKEKSINQLILDCPKFNDETFKQEDKLKNKVKKIKIG